MEEKEVFKVIDETGIEKDAEVISIFDMNDKKYAIYSVNDNEEMANVFAAEVIENEDGTKDLKEIEEVEIKNKITDMIDQIINN